MHGPARYRVFRREILNDEPQRKVVESVGQHDVAERESIDGTAPAMPVRTN